MGQCAHNTTLSLLHEDGQHQAAPGSLHQKWTLLDKVDTTKTQRLYKDLIFRNKTKFLHKSCRDNSREDLDMTGVLRSGGLDNKFDMRRLVSN